MSRTIEKAVMRASSRALEAAAAGPRAPRALSSTLLKGAITGLAAAESALAEPIVWSWQDWFTEGSPVEVYGKSTSGKTTLTALIVAAMCAPPDSPVELFGRKVVPMPEGKIALVVFDENSRPSAARKLDLAMAALGVDRAYAWDRILLYARSGLHAQTFPNDEPIRHPAPHDRWAHVMHAALIQQAFGLVVLDTRARIFGALGSSNDEEAQAHVADVISMIAKSGAPVLVLSHPRKGGGVDLDDMSGSAQRAAGTDSAISVAGIKKGGQTIASTVTLQKSRDEPDDWPKAVEFVLRWRKDGGAEFTWKQGRERPEAKAAQEKVLAALASGAMTKRELRDRLEMSNAAVTKAIDALIAETRITKGDPKIVRGVERETFCLDPSWEEIVPEE